MVLTRNIIFDVTDQPTSEVYSAMTWKTSEVLLVEFLSKHIEITSVCRKQTLS